MVKATTTLVDDLQALIDAKSDDCCQNPTCNNEAVFIVTVQFGANETDCDIERLCQDCADERKKERSDWNWGVLTQPIEGKRIIEKKKKRGRPKN
jgi:hypothetical protein